MSEQLAELIELERAQIGSEIHDALLPLIFAAQAAAGSLLQQCSADDPHRERLQQIDEWLSQSMATGRRLLTQIYPPELTGVPWSKAAHDALQRIVGDEATVQIHWDLADDVQSAPPILSLTAYRIVVEAVRNAVAHGKAGQVWIDGKVKDGRWELRIRDDGNGFDPNQIPDDRYGIRSMKARAKLVGGELELASKPTNGTTILFRSGSC